MLKVFPPVKINLSHSSVRAVTNTKENTVDTLFLQFFIFLFVSNRESGEEHEKKKVTHCKFRRWAIRNEIFN